MSLTGFPTIAVWAKKCLTAIITAEIDEEFNAAFNELIGEPTDITVNEQVLSTIQYHDRLNKETGDRKEGQATINIPDTVVTLRTEDSSSELVLSNQRVR